MRVCDVLLSISLSLGRGKKERERERRMSASEIRSTNSVPVRPHFFLLFKDGQAPSRNAIAEQRFLAEKLLFFRLILQCRSWIIFVTSCFGEIFSMIFSSALQVFNRCLRCVVCVSSQLVNFFERHKFEAFSFFFSLSRDFADVSGGGGEEEINARIAVSEKQKFLSLLLLSCVLFNVVFFSFFQTGMWQKFEL